MNDLLIDLVKIFGIEYVMAFADDLLIAIFEERDLKKAIDTVESWAH